MNSSSGIPGVSLDPPSQPQLATLGWALRRAALGMLILLVSAALGAWLLYASIEPDEASSAPSSTSQGARPQR